MIYFDRSGFALWLKRLEGSRFSWPKMDPGKTISIDAENLALLLDGINVWTRFSDVHFEELV
jgi:hypothetical protein